MSYINETDFVVDNKELVYPEIVTDGLQLYYDAKGKRDTDYHRDTMLDMSGNGNHGQLHNFAYQKHSGYKDGLVFDYIDDKLVRPELNLQPDDSTFMLNGNIISFSPDGTVKRVQDGEVIESKGFNLVRNGDFVDGDKGWMNIRGYLNQFDVIGNTAVNIQTDTNMHRSFVYNSLSIPEGNIVYSNFRFKQNNIAKSLMSILYSLSGINMVARYEITGNDFEVYSGIGPYGSSSNFRILIGNIETNEIPEIYLDYLMLIDLTETFGAGKEPTKEQMDEIINQLGFIPNAQDLIDRIEYKGNDLGDMENIVDGLYKTEVLSGEEIYTDKADDAVVHVEVDGKSYQHAGSGKNLLPHLEHWTLSGGATLDNNGILTIPLGGSANVDFLWDGSTSTQYYGYEVLQGKGRVGNAFYYDKNGNGVTNTEGIHKSNGNGKNDLVTGNHHHTMPEIDSSVHRINYSVAVTKSWGNETLKIRNIWGASSHIEYEPPTPTPDYPIEIHSLNNFDVVSSASSRNYFILSNATLGRGLIWVTGNSYYNANAIHSDYIKTNKGDVWYTNEKPWQIMFYNKYKEYLGTYLHGNLSRPPNAVGVVSGNHHIVPNEENIYYARFTFIGVKDMDKENVKFMISKNEVTTWVPAPEDILESDNHSLIDKISLLLEEPLRSVGDVKDRLFRDTDGAWKVERNVEWLNVNNSNVAFYPSYHAENYYSFALHLVAPHTFNIVSSHLPTVRNVWGREQSGIYTSGHGTWLQIPKSFVSSVSELKTKGIEIQYESETPTIDTLGQELQDKLNNLRSFEDSNYVYTVLPNENNYLPENLKPILHAKFLYNNWYKEDRVINNLMIYNRALTNEEILQNYKTIKRRWGM